MTITPTPEPTGERDAATELAERIVAYIVAPDSAEPDDSTGSPTAVIAGMIRSLAAEKLAEGRREGIEAVIHWLSIRGWDETPDLVSSIRRDLLNPSGEGEDKQ